MTIKISLLALPLLSLAGCKNETVRLQKSIEGSWKLEKIIFSNNQGAAQDSVVNYSEGGFTFRPGKADHRNEVLYQLGTNRPINATYVAESPTVFFNEPCCNVDWGQIYFMPRGSFQASFSGKDKVVLAGQAFFANRPGKPGRDVQIFLHRAVVGK